MPSNELPWIIGFQKRQSLLAARATFLLGEEVAEGLTSTVATMVPSELKPMLYRSFLEFRRPNGGQRSRLSLNQAVVAALNRWDQVDRCVVKSSGWENFFGLMNQAGSDLLLRDGILQADEFVFRTLGGGTNDLLKKYPGLCISQVVSPNKLLKVHFSLIPSGIGIQPKIKRYELVHQNSTSLHRFPQMPKGVKSQFQEAG